MRPSGNYIGHVKYLSSHLLQVCLRAAQELFPVAHPALAVHQVHVEANVVHPGRHALCVPASKWHVSVGADDGNR